MHKIARFVGEEILDSRGNPTVSASCELANGVWGHASVPSGASRGSSEAFELRDGDPGRYAGLGCRKAAQNVSGPINSAAGGRDLVQAELDELLIELDGTPNKSALGANALLATSLAFSRAAARAAGIPLYSYFGELVGRPITHLPRPTINLFSGGKHAGGQVEIQDVLVVTLSSNSIDEALAMTFDVYRGASEIVREKYHDRLLVADEGGLAPRFADVSAMLDDAVEAIARAGLKPGVDAALCVDVAASHFYEADRYRLGSGRLDSSGMIDAIIGWIDSYPIVSVEDGLAENDWSSWPELKRRVNGGALVVGDDLLTTNPDRIRRAIDIKAADTLLLKPNQIGTVTEALRACRVAKEAGWAVTFSARSGETEDSWLADLSVGWSGDQLKVGSITRSERMAKWNRLLAIERETGLPVAGWPSLGPAHTAIYKET